MTDIDTSAKSQADGNGNADPNRLRDIVIVGGGAAGLTAGIYASRAGLDTLILDKAMAGGVIAVTELVENFPGFPGGVSGFELSERIKNQALQFGAEIKEITAVSGVRRNDPDASFTVTTDAGDVRSKTIILTPGREARHSGIPGEEEFIGRGVSWCATCDGALYRDRAVAVIGGGDSAVEEGIFLTRFATKVYLVHRRDKLRAAEVAQERAFCNPKFEFVWDSIPTRILGDDAVEGLEVENVKTAEKRVLPVEGVFFYIGNIPNTQFLKGFVDLDEGGYITTDAELATSQTGVFAAGDARVSPFKQLSTAIGDGALAAHNAREFLEDQACEVGDPEERRAANIPAERV